MMYVHSVLCMNGTESLARGNHWAMATCVLSVLSEYSNGAVRTVMNLSFRDPELGVLALTFMMERIISWGKII